MAVLVKTAARLKALHQDVHFFQFSKREVGNDAEKALQYAGVGAYKSSVDLIQQHHQLVLITCQEQVTLQHEHKQSTSFKIHTDFPTEITNGLINL